MNHHARLADASFLAAFGAWLASHLIGAVPLLQALALVATIVAGFAAASYHTLLIFLRIHKWLSER